MKQFVSAKDRDLLESLIAKEKYHYCEVKSDCDSVADNLWKLAGCIRQRQEITVTYNKMSREHVTHKLRPVSIMFSEYYFYLIAYKADDEEMIPRYFRVDRITSVTEHRTKFELDKKNIRLKTPIKTVGEYDVDVWVHQQVTSSLHVSVIAG